MIYHVTCRALCAVMLAALPAQAAAQTGTTGRRSEPVRDARELVYISGAASFLARWRNAWDARDVNTLVKLYTEDAALRLPGRTMVRSRPAIESALREALAAGSPIAATDIEFTGHGDAAVVVSCYFTRQEGRVVAGLVTTILKASGRSWQIRVQVFEPPEPAEPGAQRFSCERGT